MRVGTVQVRDATDFNVLSVTVRVRFRGDECGFFCAGGPVCAGGERGGEDAVDAGGVAGEQWDADAGVGGDDGS